MIFFYKKESKLSYTKTDSKIAVRTLIRNNKFLRRKGVSRFGGHYNQICAR